MPLDFSLVGRIHAMASLLVVSGSSSGDFYLLGRATLVIGRDEGCPIQIVDDTVSRKHVEIRPDKRRKTYLIADLKSANGTLLNDHAIDTDRSLADGDIIKLGGTELMFSEVDFADGETAFQHYRRRGEGAKSTIISKK